MSLAIPIQEEMQSLTGRQLDASDKALLASDTKAFNNFMNGIKLINSTVYDPLDVQHVWNQIQAGNHQIALIQAKTDKALDNEVGVWATSRAS